MGKGWIDLVLVNPAQRRVLFRELKAADGTVGIDQHQVLIWLHEAGQDTGLWRPEDMDSGRIERELRA